MNKAAEKRRAIKPQRGAQFERFIRTARELGCDEDPKAFERAVKKLAKAPPPAPRKRKERDDDKQS